MPPTLFGVVAIGLFSAMALLTTCTAGVPTFEVLALGFTVSTVFAVVFARVQGQDPVALLRQPFGAWALGIGGFFGYHVCYFLAMRHAPPAEANLLNYLWPLLIVLFSAFLPGYGLHARHVGGALLGLAGTYLLVGGGRVFGHMGGDIAAIGAAVTWALYSVLSRRYPDVPTAFVGVYCVATAVLAWVCHFLLEPTLMPSPGQWAAIGAIGVGPVGAAFLAWDRGIKHGNLQALGALSYAAPLLSTALLVAAGKAQPSWNILAACVLIMGGAVLASARSVARP